MCAGKVLSALQLEGWNAARFARVLVALASAMNRVPVPAINDAGRAFREKGPKESDSRARSELWKTPRYRSERRR